MYETFFGRILAYIGLKRFSRCTRRVLQLARQEAKRLNSQYVDSEHVLLALIKGERGIAATVLFNLRMNFTDIENEIKRLVAAESEDDKKKNNGSQSRDIIMRAIKESKDMKHNCVGTEDLLLALLYFNDGIAAQTLTNLKLDFKKVRPEIERILGGMRE
jgi:ATP-dependent Clp protease ATP-binding subunit ClpC